MTDVVLIVVAIILFILAGLKVQSKLDLVALGFACLAGTLIN